MFAAASVEKAPPLSRMHKQPADLLLLLAPSFEFKKMSPLLNFKKKKNSSNFSFTPLIFCHVGPHSLDSQLEILVLYALYFVKYFRCFLELNDPCGPINLNFSMILDRCFRSF